MGENRQARASDGTVLRYTVSGSGKRRFVLTHSLAMQGEFWQPLIDALGDNVSVLTWDCRGHGGSGKPAGPYTVEGFADDLAQVMDDAGWPSAIAAGASMGGCVTLAFAMRHRERAVALGLFDTTAFYGDTAPSDWEGRANKALDNGLRSLVDFQKTRWFSDAFRQANPRMVERCVEIFCANDLAAYAETCRMLGRADLRAGLVGIDVPTEVVVGEEDYATPPAMAEAMHAAIGDSSLQIVEGARHLSPLECPDLIAAKLLGLAERVTPQ